MLLETRRRAAPARGRMVGVPRAPFDLKSEGLCPPRCALCRGAQRRRGGQYSCPCMRWSSSKGAIVALLAGAPGPPLHEGVHRGRGVAGGAWNVNARNRRAACCRRPGCHACADRRGLRPAQGELRAVLVVNLRGRAPSRRAHCVRRGAERAAHERRDAPVGRQRVAGRGRRRTCRRARWRRAAVPASPRPAAGSWPR